MKIRPVEAKLLHAKKKTHKQMHRHEEVNKPFKIKGKNHNSQTKRYLYNSILVIYYSIMCYMF